MIDEMTFFCRCYSPFFDVVKFHLQPKRAFAVQEGYVLRSGQGSTAVCSFPFIYTPPPPVLRPSSVSLKGGTVRLILAGYAAALGPSICTVVVGGRAGSTFKLSYAVTVYNITAPPAPAIGLVPVELDCAGDGTQDFGLFLQYVAAPHAELQGAGDTCVLFVPCTIMVRLYYEQVGAFAVTFRAWIQDAGSSETEKTFPLPSVQACT